MASSALPSLQPFSGRSVRRSTHTPAIQPREGIPFECPKVLLTGEVCVVDRLFGKALATRHTVWSDGQKEFAALALLLLDLGSILLCVTVPVGGAGVRAAPLAAATGNPASLSPVGLIAPSAPKREVDPERVACGGERGVAAERPRPGSKVAVHQPGHPLCRRRAQPAVGEADNEPHPVERGGRPRAVLQLARGESVRGFP
eukprot:scaffold166462_cov30-Tisochrysis_lutea.AAC.3